jgi:hypothetical protein
VTVNGKITITFRCEKVPSEEQHQALIGALEFLFGARPDFDLTVEGGAPFGYEMDAMMIETGSPWPKQADAREAPESAKDFGERAFREAAPNRLGVVKPPGIYIKQELNNDWIARPEERRATLPICGAVYQDGDFRAECKVDRAWPHEEHSSGEWHWRNPDGTRWIHGS